MYLWEAFDSEDVLDGCEGGLIEDLVRPDSVIIEEVFCREKLGHTMSSLLAHIFGFLLHELVCAALLTRLRMLVRIERAVHLVAYCLRLEVGRTNRTVFTYTEQVTAIFT